MSQGFREITLGGVLVAPFVGYAAAALALTAVLRPLARHVPIAHLVANPSLAWLCVYVLILSTLFVFF